MPPVVALIFIGIIFYYISNILFNFLSNQSLKFLFPVASALIYIFSLKRDKNNFLKSITSHRNLLKIKLIDSLSFAVLPIGFLLFQQEFFLAITCLILHILVVFIIPDFKTNFTIQTPFTKFPFEFIVGFRKNYLVLLILNALGVVSIVTGNPNIGAFTIIALSLLFSFFFSKSEERFFIWIFSVGPKKFLMRKVKTILICTSLVNTPIFIALLIVYPQQIILFILSQIAGFLLVIASALAKYASYPSGINLDYLSILVVSLLAPPVLIFSVPYFYYKSKCNLLQVL